MLRSRSTIAACALLLSAEAQEPWMRRTELLCAYHRSVPYGDEVDQDIYLFYANDSVVHFTYGSWEGAIYPNNGRTLVADLDRTIAEWHCDPDMYAYEMDVSWYTGGAVVWRGRSYMKALFKDDGTLLLLDDERYIRVKCWERIIGLPERGRAWYSPCEGEASPGDDRR